MRTGEGESLFRAEQIKIGKMMVGAAIPALMEHPSLIQSVQRIIDQDYSQLLTRQLTFVISSSLRSLTQSVPSRASAAVRKLSHDMWRSQFIRTVRRKICSHERSGFHSTESPCRMHRSSHGVSPMKKLPSTAGGADEDSGEGPRKLRDIADYCDSTISRLGDAYVGDFRRW